MSHSYWSSSSITSCSTPPGACAAGSRRTPPRRRHCWCERLLIRYVNTVIAGAIGGLAGAFLTMEAVGTFERSMTNGRGFVALAVMIFGKWTPLGSFGAALLFGFASAMQTQLQFAGTVDIPHQFIE